jgi:hypothetical protein
MEFHGSDALEKAGISVPGSCTSEASEINEGIRDLVTMTI